MNALLLSASVGLRTCRSRTPNVRELCVRPANVRDSVFGPWIIHTNVLSMVRSANVSEL